MRRIKFRAWDKEKKEMLLWDDHKDWICDAIPLDAGDEWTERCEVMQYTGVNDNKGNEIYEGDIVKYKYDGDMLSHGGERIFIVQSLKDVDYLSFDCLAGKERYELKVIGNIYKNPKLMKEKK